MKRNAFTLTELLVVVVIIGVLSAVVLPKFTKVIETRKTTEAEEMMTAVRNEQEARCSLSKNYTDIEKLGSYRAGKNFHYANNSEGVGIIATARNEKYNLEIPSYADGRVCCSDIEAGACANLNKSYPSCEELKAKADYAQGNNECEVPTPSCDNSHQEGEEASNTPCECGGPRREEWTCQGSEWIKTLVQDCKDPGKCNPCKDTPKPTDPPVSTTDENGCTVMYEWAQASYPACWEPKEKGKECPKSDSTCGTWENPGDGPMDAVEICWSKLSEDGSQRYTVDFNKPIAEDATVEEVEASCCILCPSGEYMTDAGICCPNGVAGIVTGEGEATCGDCSSLGSNYYFDGSKCAKRYTMKEASFVIVGGPVYENFQPSFSSCSFDFTGQQVQQCGTTKTRILDEQGNSSYQTTATPPKEDICDQCDANSLECHVASCYDPQDYAKQEATYGTYEKAQINKSTGIGVGVSGCAGNVTTTGMPAWYETIGLTEPGGDRYLCGMGASTGSNGLWLSDFSVPTGYCKTCGGKSKEVSLFVSLHKVHGGPNCDDVYMVGDYTQGFNIFDYEEYDYWNMLNGPQGLNINWDQIRKDIESTAQFWDNYYNEQDAQKAAIEGTDWSANYTVDEFANLFGIDLNNLSYLGWYTIQTAYYGNNMGYNPASGTGNNSNPNGWIETIFQNTSDGYDQQAWSDWMYWLGENGKLPDNYTNPTHDGWRDCPTSVRLCAAPRIIPVKGYACRRK